MGAVPMAVKDGAPPHVRYLAAKFDEHLSRLARPDHSFQIRDFYSGNASIRRNELLTAGLFDDRFRSYGNEDLELAHRLVKSGVRLGFSPEAVAYCVLRIPSFARALRERDPAVFHAHLTWPLGAKNALLAAIAARQPAVLVTAQLYMDVPVTRPMLVQQRLIAAGVDRFLVVSRHSARRLEAMLRWPRRKMDVIHNAVDSAAFARRPDPDLRRGLAGEQPLVLVVARLAPQKGHRHLLAAAAEVPDAVFALAGDGPERPALEELADRLGVRNRIRFLGERSDVADLLAACDLFVLPSLFEGLPISLLEAMAAERPVIATAIGGTDEVVIDGQSGLLVPPGEPAAMASAIRRLLEDPALRARLAAAGRARVTSEFSAPQMVRRVTELYELFSEPQAQADGQS
jgi:glycosyltransferase involved in cell wall biosynthesis